MHLTPLNLICFFLLAFSNCFALAQDNTLTIYGVVTDAVSGLPVTEANVLLERSLEGTATNAAGQFSLTVQQSTSTTTGQDHNLFLTVSSIGYDPITVAISNSGDQKLSIELQPKVFELDEFNLSDKPTVVYANQRFHVHDYLFVKQLLLAITYKTSPSNASLTIIDKNRQIVASIPVPEKGIRLYRDCLDKVYVMASESARDSNRAETDSYIHLKEEPYRIEKDQSGKLALTRMEPDFFRENILPCVAKSQKTYYYQIPKNLGFAQVYRSFNESLGTHQHIRTIADWDMLNLYVDQSNPQYRLKRFGAPKSNRQTQIAMLDAGGFGNITMDINEAANFLNNMRKREVGDRFDEEFVYKTLNCPMHKIGERLYIFNHFADSLERYDLEGKLTSKANIGYHHEPGWKDEILVDRITQKAYALYNRKGYHQLAEINLEDGTLGQPVLLHRDHRYAEKVKVHNGLVYFLHRPKGSAQTRYLFRQRL